MQLWKESDYIEDITTALFIVFMSPAEFTYLDMKCNSKTTLGLNWAGYIDVEKASKWKLNDSIEESLTPSIIGVEVPLWTETITNISELEYMVFARMSGYA